jgi:ABC-type dipeptide/oligopeptide/nickel transport system permease component
MGLYLATRLAQLLPILLVILVLNFIIIHLAPGDPSLYLIGDAPVSEEFVAEVRARMGLDEPMWYQLWLYLAGVAQGDLGYSFISRAPVSEVILARLPATLLLMGTQYVIAIGAGIVLGAVSARWRGGALDTGVTLFSVIGYAMPVFWLGQILMLIFALQLRWLPAQGMLSLRYDLTPWQYTLDLAQHLILPAVTLAFFNLALIVRLTRANMLQILRLEYVMFARSKGLSESVVLFRHALKNAVLPVVTIIGLNVKTLVAGAVLTETVFAWPGLGRLTYDAIYARDYPVLMGMFVLIGILVVVGNLVTDLIYAWLDPRIRFR